MLVSKIFRSFNNNVGSMLGSYYKFSILAGVLIFLSILFIPVLKNPVLKKPVLKNHVLKNPVLKKPVLKKPVLKKPVLKNPVLKKTDPQYDSRKSPLTNYALTDSVLACHLTPYQPWDLEAKKYIPIPKDTNITCKEKPPLLERVNATHLTLNVEVATKYYGVENSSQVVCLVCEITRVNYTKGKSAAYHDNNYRLSNDCHVLNTNEEIPFAATFVKCLIGDHEIYRNIYSAFPIKVSESGRKQRSEKLSVLFIVLDALSKNHFHRAFPLTDAFIKDKEFVHFNKFISSGSHTLPNVINSFSGELYTEADCWTFGCKNITYDKTNFIWKEFQKAGYVTAYFDDQTNKAGFNYAGGGFIKQPTEYYGRPATLALEKLLEIKKIAKYDYLKCYGDRLFPEIILEDSRNFASKFKSDPYLGIFWTSAFTHDKLKAGFYGDIFYVNLLMDLFSTEDILNNTMLFFIADHGMGFGRFRSTNMAWMESKMPIYTIWLPQWFRRKYTTAMENVLSNADRLVSSFDIYKTLRDILNNDFSGTGLNNGTGISLFRPIPKVRTCDDAGIDPGSCVCSKPAAIDVHLPIVTKVVEKSIQHMEKVLGAKVGVICDELMLDNVLSAWLLRREKEYSDYLVTFQASPGPAIVQGNIRLRSGTSEALEVNRIDRYGNQSYCVTGRFEKMYCHCKLLQ